MHDDVEKKQRTSRSKQDIIKCSEEGYEFISLATMEMERVDTTYLKEEYKKIPTNTEARANESKQKNIASSVHSLTSCTNKRSGIIFEKQRMQKYAAKAICISLRYGLYPTVTMNIPRQNRLLDFMTVPTPVLVLKSLRRRIQT